MCNSTLLLRLRINYVRDALLIQGEIEKIYFPKFSNEATKINIVSFY